MRTVTISTSVDLHPTGITDSNFGSITNPSNAYSQADSPSPAVFKVPTTNGTYYCYFTFTTNAIPSNATISSVTAQFKAKVTNSSRLTSAKAVMYKGSSPVGNQASYLSTTEAIYQLTGLGGWTRSELDNIKLRFEATRLGSTSTVNASFYGADITVAYDASTTYYEVTSSSEVSGTTTSVSGTDSNNEIESGGTSTVSVYTADISTIIISDNGNDVTSSFSYDSVNNCYSYTMASVSADHDFHITSASKPVFIKTNGTWVQLSKLMYKTNGSWAEVQKTFIKENGTWAECDDACDIFTESMLRWVCGGNVQPT